MVILTQSLALCTVFIFLSISVLLTISVYYLCKYKFAKKQLEQCMKLPKNQISEYHRFADANKEIEVPYYSVYNLPKIMLESEELPPEYYDLESARASPLPSYDEMIYCDQLSRSFQNLLSAR